MPARDRAILLIVFFISGASALAYEVTWVRLLNLSFGVSVYAASAVLTAFMAGLALGSWLFGRVADRLSGAGREPARLLRLYAWLQAGTGAWALLTPLLFDGLTGLYIALHRSLEPGFLLFNVLRFCLSVLVLLVPTSLMGGTFPVLSQLLAAERQRRSATLGALYAANTFGGVAGTLAAGFFLIGLAGTRVTIGLAALLDFAAAAVALWLSRSTTIGGSAAAERGAPERRARPVEGPPRGPRERLVLWAFAISGAAALGYEVVWVRLLAILSLNAVFSFTIMLATFLVGLAAGGAAAARLADRARAPLKALGWLQVGIGGCGVAVMFVFKALPALVAARVEVDSIGRQIAVECVAAALTMLPPALLMGAAFPLSARVYAGGAGAVGGPVGRLYGANTLGAAAGAMIAGLALVPLLGLKGSGLMLAAVNLSVGAALLLWEAPRPALRLSAAAAAALAAAALVPRGVWLGYRQVNARDLVFYHEGADATVSVFQVGRPPIKISYVNGRSEVPTDPISMRTFYLLGHLPPLLRPDAESALMVSFGNGIATGAMSRHRVPRIHAVDLVAGQVQAARLYGPENRGVLAYPGLTLTIEDGRNFVLRSRERFDIITADSTHPINTSSWALFTQEFYTLVRARLADGGVFLQWLPFHDLSMADYKSIIRTFQSVFPHTTLWYTGGPHTFMLATPAGLTLADVLALEPRIRAAGVTDDLGGARQLARCFLMTQEEVAAYVAGAEIVTDDRAFFVPAIELERILDSFAPYGEAGARGRVP